VHGSVTWTLLKEEVRRSEAFEIWIWRKWKRYLEVTEHKANEEVVELVQKERKIFIDNIETKTEEMIGSRVAS